MGTVRLIIAIAAMCWLSACDASPGHQAAEPVASPPVAQDSPVPSASSGTGSTEAIVKAVMQREYGDKFRADYGCWEFHSDELDFCMKPGEPQVIEADGKRRLYFIATNRTDIQDPAYGYGHPVPGVMGAFEITLGASGQWSLTAAAKDLSFGSSGSCGCEGAKLTRLGRAYYGWLFASGGVWQGIVVLNHYVVAPHQGTFEVIGDFPKITEDDQDSEYSIAVDNTDAGADVYPINLTQTTSGKKVGMRKAIFDAGTWRYTLKE